MHLSSKECKMKEWMQPSRDLMDYKFFAWTISLTLIFIVDGIPAESMASPLSIRRIRDKNLLMRVSSRVVGETNVSASHFSGSEKCLLVMVLVLVAVTVTVQVEGRVVEAPGALHKERRGNGLHRIKRE